MLCRVCKTYFKMEAKKLEINILSNSDIIDNSWTVEDICNKRKPLGWEEVFENSVNELKDISNILINDVKINGRFLPDMKNLFRAFELTPLKKVKVVIMGQDPYHGCNSDGTPQAQGLSFSVKKNAKIPSSLNNIYKELKDNFPENFSTPKHGDLTLWALQGVLLLNSCLTVRPHCPGSHKELWLGFIKKVINAIIDVNPGCIFVLWGRKAQKIKKIIGERVTILEAAHPSGFSAYRGFFGCGHFKQINQHLIESGQNPINWQL